jgi:hypothetical protein
VASTTEFRAPSRIPESNPSNAQLIVFRIDQRVEQRKSSLITPVNMTVDCRFTTVNHLAVRVFWIAFLVIAVIRGEVRRRGTRRPPVAFAAEPAAARRRERREAW